MRNITGNDNVLNNIDCCTLSHAEVNTTTSGQSTGITTGHIHECVFTQATSWTEVCLGYPTEATASWTIYVSSCT